MPFTNPTYIERFGAAVVGSDGNPVSVDSLAQTTTYSGSQISTASVTDASGNTYVQTYSYTNGLLTGISAWVKQ